MFYVLVHYIDAERPFGPFESNEAAWNWIMHEDYGEQATVYECP